MATRRTTSVEFVRSLLSDQDCRGGFVVGLAIGVLLGFHLVRKPRREELPVESTEGPPPQQEHRTTPPIEWTERSDVIRLTPGLSIPPGSYLWRSSMLVAITPEAQETMDRYASGDTRTERMGYLVGRVGHTQTGSELLTIVEQAVPLPSSYATATHVAITSESLSVLAAAVREFPPGVAAVGWFHTHPGLGIFLSGTDHHTQRTCFPHEWQVAVVLDPVDRAMGVFTGPSGVRAKPVSVPR